ncbi:MAG: hypothetical protein IT209_02955 [Armatimonadetes bacterium]|nr:hypothetical protein [Armatimonadota bacterium]
MTMRTSLVRTGAALVMTLCQLASVHAGIDEQRDACKACADNAQKVGRALSLYADDWGGRFPPATTPAQLQATLVHYVDSASTFWCQSTGLFFRPNPALAGASVFDVVTDWDKLPAVSDLPLTNRRATVAFLDGHVERAGKDTRSPRDINTDRVRRLARALKMYTDDWNSYLPKLDNPSALPEVLYPYLHSHSVFVSPLTGTPFVVNPAFSEVHETQVSLTDPFIWDYPPQLPEATVAYWDGRIVVAGTLIDAEFWCRKHLSRLAMSVRFFADDHMQLLPRFSTEADLRQDLAPYAYLGDPFVCPVTGQAYEINHALKGSLVDYQNPAATWMFRDALAHDGARNTAYMSGAVIAVPAD